MSTEGATELAVMLLAYMAIMCIIFIVVAVVVGW
jgi:hypothetical protein